MEEVRIQSGRVPIEVRPAPLLSIYLCCLWLYENGLGMGCLGQFNVQNAIFQDRAHLRSVNLCWQVNDI
jgi:hypothetical protein